MDSPKKWDIGSLPVFRPLNGQAKYELTIEIVETLRKTGRDRTVQRESVWRDITNKREEYMTAVAHGYSNTSLFHLVNIKDSIEYLTPLARNAQDLKYIEHLRSFLSQGCERLHVDGGNRSDTIIDWYDNKIALMPGQYPLPSGQRVTLASTNTYTRQLLIDEGGVYAELSDHIDNQQFTYFEYGQLDETDRKQLFINLNANENLTVEEFRNCETADICGWVRDLNDEYKPMFVDYGFVTKANAERYKFCSWLASLLNFYKFNNSCDSWNTSNLDKDYKGTNGTQDNFPEFKTLFETTFVPLVDTIANYSEKYKGNQSFRNLGKHRNLLVDLWIVLVRLDKKGISLTKDSSYKPNVKAFFEAYKAWVDPHLADTKAQYNANANTLSTFADLYGANSAPKLKCRLELLDNEFIPSLGKDVIVEKDVARNFPDAWRMILWQRQDGICPLTGKTISQSDASDGNITHMDHIVPHSKGGKTIKENAQLVFASANLEKSDKW